MRGASMDLGTIGGIVAIVTLLVTSIFMEGEMASFMDFPSLMITMGGAIASTFIAFPPKQAITGFLGIRYAFSISKIDEKYVMKEITELSAIARRSGLLSLEDEIETTKDPFLKKGIQLIVDATDLALMRKILEAELRFIENRYAIISGYWEKLGELAPFWGMVGTVFGLVNMLTRMNDLSVMGTYLAFALMAIFYAMLLTVVIANPFSHKIKIKAAEELRLKAILLEGLFDIQAGENSRIIREKLQALLLPDDGSVLVDNSDAFTEGEK